MDEECDELADIQQLEEDLCDMSNDQDEDDDVDHISTSMLLNHKIEESPSSRNGLDISVKLEVSILESEENQTASKDQQVNQLTNLFNIMLNCDNFGIFIT